MIDVQEQSDQTFEFRHAGNWTADDMRAYLNTLYELAETENDLLYIVFDFSETTYVNPNTLSAFLNDPVFKSGKVGLGALVCAPPLCRFVDQTLQVIGMRSRDFPLRRVETREAGLQAIHARRMADARRARHLRPT